MYGYCKLWQKFNTFREIIFLPGSLEMAIQMYLLTDSNNNYFFACYGGLIGHSSSQWTSSGLHNLSHLSHLHPLLVSSPPLTTEWSHHQLCPHLQLRRQHHQQHQNQQHQSDHHRSGAIHQLHLFCECLNSCGRWSCCSVECSN